MIYGVEGIDPQRREDLMDLLDIDPYWRLNRLSDGQRRRVQICMGLLRPYDVRRPSVPSTHNSQPGSGSTRRYAWASSGHTTCAPNPPQPLPGNLPLSAQPPAAHNW
jgi:hypothetical protein